MNQIQFTVAEGDFLQPMFQYLIYTVFAKQQHKSQLAF